MRLDEDDPEKTKQTNKQMTFPKNLKGIVKRELNKLNSVQEK